MNTTAHNKPNLAVINGFVRTEKPTPQPEPETNTPHTLDLLRHLPDGHFKQYVGDVAKMCNIHPISNCSRFCYNIVSIKM